MVCFVLTQKNRTWLGKLTLLAAIVRYGWVLEEWEKASWFHLQAWKINIFCEDCTLAAPLSFFRSFGPRFFIFVLFLGFCPVWRFEVCFELIFTLITFDKKGNAVLLQSGLRFFNLRRKGTTSSQSTSVQEDLCSRLFMIAHCSFDSGPCAACLVRTQDEVLLLRNWDNNY